MGLFRQKASRPAQIARLLKEGDSARDARDWTNAGVFYRQVLELDAKHDAIWVQLGHALKEAGDLSGAEGAYVTALDLRADSSDAHLQMGHMHKILGRLDDALLSYEAAFFLDPSSVHAREEVKATRADLRKRMQIQFESIQSTGNQTPPETTTSAWTDQAIFRDQLNSLYVQMERVIGHVAITKALAFEVRKLSKRLEEIAEHPEHIDA